MKTREPPERFSTLPAWAFPDVRRRHTLRSYASGPVATISPGPSDEDEFCRWWTQHPDYFSKERPFVGYVQFLLETSFKGSQRLTRFEADVDWSVGGMHQPAKDTAAQKRQENLKWWGFSRRGRPTSQKRLTGKLNLRDFYRENEN